MTDRPQLHVSWMNTLSVCGVQFQRRYGHRFDCWHKEEIIPPNVALITGISVHKAVDANMRNKVDNGELLPREQVADIARDAFAKTKDSGFMLSADEAINADKTLGAAVDQTISLAVLHSDEVAPIIDPVEVEQAFVIELPEKYGIDLAGRIDIIEADSSIDDTKTCAPSRVSPDAHTIQTTMYSLARVKETGKLPKRTRLQHLVKTKTPKVVIRESIPEMSWFDPLYRRIEAVANLLKLAKAGHAQFMPAQPDSWQCSKKWCGYASSCPYWSGK